MVELEQLKNLQHAHELVQGYAETVGYNIGKIQLEDAMNRMTYCTCTIDKTHGMIYTPVYHPDMGEFSAEQIMCEMFTQLLQHVEDLR